MSFFCKILTKNQIVYEGLINKITFNSYIGEITILSEHQNLIGIITPGIIYINDNNQNNLIVDKGYFMFQNNTLSIVLSYAILGSKICLQKVLEIKNKLKNKLDELDDNNVFLKNILVNHLRFCYNQIQYLGGDLNP